MLQFIRTFRYFVLSFKVVTTRSFINVYYFFFFFFLLKQRARIFSFLLETRVRRGFQQVIVYETIIFFSFFRRYSNLKII